MSTATDVYMTSPGVLDVLGATLRRTAARLDAHCLVEVDDGSVIAHALGSGAPPDQVTDAVLRRTSAPLIAMTDSPRRSVMPGGTLIVGHSDEGHWMHVAPLQRAGTRTGWLWILSSGQLAVADIADEVPAVVAALPTTPPDAEHLAVAAALASGTALPLAWVRAASRVWVVTVEGAPAQDVQRALEMAARNLRPIAVMDGDRTHAVLLGAVELAQPEVEARMENAVATAGRVVGSTLRAGISEPADPTAPLADAVRQASIACEMSFAGRCLPAREARARYVLHVAREALRDLPPLGPDPVRRLLDYDRRRGTELSRSLRGWLDAGRDVAAAADDLFVHSNTLRYRLKRAAEVMGTTLDDVDVLIEVHLRLPR